MENLRQCIFQKGLGEGGTAHQFLAQSYASEIPSGIKLSQSTHISYKVFSFKFLVLNLQNEILFPTASTDNMTLLWDLFVSFLQMQSLYRERHWWENERLGYFPFMILLMESVPGYLKLLQNGLQAPPLWPLPLADVILGKGMRASLWFPPRHLWWLRMACWKHAECRAER